MRAAWKWAAWSTFLEMELAGIEPVTSWVRFKQPVGRDNHGRFRVLADPSHGPARATRGVLDSELDSEPGSRLAVAGCRGAGACQEVAELQRQPRVA